jgi:phosphoethanolamine N-methyltransferase
MPLSSWNIGSPPSFIRPRFGCPLYAERVLGRMVKATPLTIYSGPMEPHTKDFLDEHQYTEAAISAYEVVYGQDFVSTGGSRTTREMLARLELVPGERVLDVGCGLGGSAFMMARESGARVDGIDLSQNMIAMAQERLERHGLEHLVRLEHGDCLELDRPAAYDVVYSRDVFLHLHDKERLFRVLSACLRPGGRLLFTDYCSGPPPWSPAFSAYVERYRYSLHTLEEYAEVLRAAGLVEVRATDLTETFIAIHRREVEEMADAALDDEQRRELAAGWEAKIERANQGEQRWGLFQARRTSG